MVIDPDALLPHGGRDELQSNDGLFALRCGRWSRLMLNNVIMFGAAAEQLHGVG